MAKIQSLLPALKSALNSTTNTTFGLTKRFLSNLPRFAEYNNSGEDQGKVVVDGVGLHWEKYGDGPNVVLFFPGLLGTIEMNYYPVFSKMDTQNFTMIGMDLPGYGKSYPPIRDVFTEEHCQARDARLAHLLMQELGYEKYSTVGWSTGGISGLLVAAAYPKSVNKVILCNTPFQYNALTRSAMDVLVDLKNWTPEQQKAILSVYDESYATKVLKDWKNYIYYNHATQEFPKYLAAELKKVEAPTLFIRSNDDRITTLKDVRKMSRIIPDFRSYRVAKGAHSHLEFLDDFVEVTEAFLSS